MNMVNAESRVCIPKAPTRLSDKDFMEFFETISWASFGQSQFASLSDGKRFALDEEQEEVSPQDPSMGHFVLLMGKTPTNAKPRACPIEKGNTGDLSQPEPTPFTPTLPYNMFRFTWLAKNSDANAGDDPVFVSTGSSQGNVMLPSFTFMRPDEVLKRVQCQDIDQLKGLYARDLFIAQQYQKAGQTSSGKSHNHLPLWQQNGKFVECSSFLGKLLGDVMVSGSGGQIKSINIVQNIFRAWCSVAYAGSAKAKAPWSVYARYWNPSNVSKEVVMFVTPHAQLLPFDNAEARKSWAEKMETNLNKAIEKHTVTDTNETTIVALGFKNVYVVPFIPPDLVHLGDSPSGFFSTHMTDTHVTILENSHSFWSPLKQRATPRTETDLLKLNDYCKQESKGYTDMLGENLELVDQPVTTITQITDTSVSEADGKVRVSTQQATMGNLSATKVAHWLWFPMEPDKVALRKAEWLHKSAYSFGGLQINGQSVPDSQQAPKNLVFGTVAANTHMMRYEAHLKRLINQGKTVRLDTSSAAPHGRPFWFPETLTYTWQANDAMQPSQFTFDLRSNWCPSLIEVYLDEEC